MSQHRNEQSVSKQKRKSPISSTSQSMREVNNLKLKKYYKHFKLVDSPEIVFDLCDKAYSQSRNRDFVQQKDQKLDRNKTQLLQKETGKRLQRKSHIPSNYEKSINYQVNDGDLVKQSDMSKQKTKKKYPSILEKLSYMDDRKFYVEIKEKMAEIIGKVETEKQISTSELLILKQDILSSFLSDIISKCTSQCREKGQLIQYIWNSMFSLLELCFRQMHLSSHNIEHSYLQQTINNHHKYQQMLEYDKSKIQKLKESLQKSTVFNNTLIFDLRCKRRELQKAYRKLKICTNKLNEYKQSYLDLQRDHIDLLMDSRDISKEMAQYLFRRRQEILQDKKKTFKLKFSKKSNFLNTKKQIQTEPPKEHSQVTEQLQQAFSKEYLLQLEQSSKESKKLKKLTNFLFEDAMDEFAFYQNNEEINEDIMASRMKTTFVDAETDMIGFELQQEDRGCQIDYLQKIVYGMAKNCGQQTVPIDEKPKKVFIENFAQVEGLQLKMMQLQVQNKVYDMSFLYEKKASNQFLANRSLPNEKDRDTPTKSTKKLEAFRRNSISINKKEGSQISINISSKKVLQSKKRISRRISELSEFQRQSLLNSQNSPQRFEQGQNYGDENEGENSNKKNESNKTYDEDDKISEISDGYNFEEYTAKFALKKGLRKKKQGITNLVEKDSSKERSQLSDSDQQDNSVFGFIRTKKNSRFSKQTKRNSNSLNVQDQRKTKKNSFLGNNENQNSNAEDTKKKIKRQPLNKRNSRTPERTLSKFSEQKFNKSPQKAQVMKLLSKSRKDIEDDEEQLNRAISKIKADNPMLEINEEMESFIKIRQSQEKSHFFMNFYKSISPLVNDLYSHIDSTKKFHRSLLPSRHKNLCKIISNVYIQAYHLLQNNEPIHSLINPLFHYFEIGYGMLKKYDLYSRMISFLAHVAIHKDESYIFYSFLFFTGIDKDNPLSRKITSQDVVLYLKLLKSLAFNFSLSNGPMGLNVINLFTSNLVLQKNTKEVLIEQRMSETIIEKVLSKVQEKLQRLTGVDMRSTYTPFSYSPSKSAFNRTSSFNRTQSTWNPNRNVQQQSQIKLDVFKCCQLIMEEIILMKKSIEDSYLPLINYVYEAQDSLDDYRLDESLIQFIIRCQFRPKLSQVKSYKVLNNIFKMNTLYNQYKQGIEDSRQAKSCRQLKTLRTLKTIKFILPQNEQLKEYSQRETLSIKEMCSFFLKANIFDLNKTYYNAMNIFKLKEEHLLHLCIKRLSSIRQYFQSHNMKIQLILIQEICDETKDVEKLLTKTSGQSVYDMFSMSFTNGARDWNGLKYDPMANTLNGNNNMLTLKQIHNKKLINLCFLRFLESRVNQTLEDLIGTELGFLYNFIPVSKSKL